MHQFSRTKRVTDPLDDRVKNRIIDYISSGSQHSAAAADSFSSPSFFADSVCLASRAVDEEIKTDSDSESDSDCESDRTDAIINIINSIKNNQNSDSYGSRLLTHTTKGVQILESLNNNKQVLNRNVMLYLQQNGYNAAICKTKWLTNGGLTGGNYEFIDVIRSDTNDRYYIDLSFASEFSLARETKEYTRLTRYLPKVFVEKSDDLKKLVKLISDAGRRSLKTKGLIFPPWRKNRFMQMKWFGPYRRTGSYLPTVNSSLNVVKCSAVGFNAGVFVNAVTRTR
ncbi:GMP synthase [Tanacetum coccineum]